MRTDGERVAPGVLVKPRRFVPRFHWELLVCGIGGHELVGTDAREVRESDAAVARDLGGVRWHRCLRCDSWVWLPEPVAPTIEFPPPREAIELPLRGRPLRDKVVLRLIAINRAAHFVVLSLIGVAILLFSANRANLHDVTLRVITDITGGTTTDATASGHGLRHEIDSLFSLQSSKLHLFAAIALAYAFVEGLEAVGLWLGKRWAEYLTLIVTASLLPVEVYEMTHRLTPFKVTAFI